MQDTSLVWKKHLYRAGVKPYYVPKVFKSVKIIHTTVLPRRIKSGYFS